MQSGSRDASLVIHDWVRTVIPMRFKPLYILLVFRKAPLQNTITVFQICEAFLLVSDSFEAHTSSVMN